MGGLSVKGVTCVHLWLSPARTRECGHTYWMLITYPPMHACRSLCEADVQGAALLLTRAFAGTAEAVKLDEAL